MRPGIGLACFVVEFLSRVLAVDHMYGKKVGVLFRCDLNKRFRRTGIQAGFDTIVHQVKKDTAEVTVFNIHFFWEQQLKTGLDIMFCCQLAFTVQNRIDQIVVADRMKAFLLEITGQCFQTDRSFIISLRLHQSMINFQFLFHILL